MNIGEKGNIRKEITEIGACCSGTLNKAKK